MTDGKHITLDEIDDTLDEIRAFGELLASSDPDTVFAERVLQAVGRAVFEKATHIQDALLATSEAGLAAASAKLGELEREAEDVDIDEVIDYLRRCCCKVLELRSLEAGDDQYIVSHGWTEKGLRAQWALWRLLDAFEPHRAETGRACAA